MPDLQNSERFAPYMPRVSGVLMDGDFWRRESDLGFLISPTFPLGMPGFTNLRSSSPILDDASFGDGRWFPFCDARSLVFSGSQNLRTQRTSIDFDPVTSSNEFDYDPYQCGCCFWISHANKVLGDVGGAFAFMFSTFFNQGPRRIHCEMSCWMLPVGLLSHLPADNVPGCMLRRPMPMPNSKQGALSPVDHVFYHPSMKMYI